MLRPCRLRRLLLNFLTVHGCLGTALVGNNRASLRQDNSDRLEPSLGRLEDGGPGYVNLLMREVFENKHLQDALVASKAACDRMTTEMEHEANRSRPLLARREDMVLLQSKRTSTTAASKLLAGARASIRHLAEYPIEEAIDTPEPLKEGLHESERRKLKDLAQKTQSVFRNEQAVNFLLGEVQRLVQVYEQDDSLHRELERMVPVAHNITDAEASKDPSRIAASLADLSAQAPLMAKRLLSRLNLETDVHVPTEPVRVDAGSFLQMSSRPGPEDLQREMQAGFEDAKKKFEAAGEKMAKKNKENAELMKKTENSVKDDMTKMGKRFEKFFNGGRLKFTELFSPPFEEPPLVIGPNIDKYHMPNGWYTNNQLAMGMKLVFPCGEKACFYVDLMVHAYLYGYRTVPKSGSPWTTAFLLVPAKVGIVTKTMSVHYARFLAKPEVTMPGSKESFDWSFASTFPVEKRGWEVGFDRKNSDFDKGEGGVKALLWIATSLTKLSLRSPRWKNLDTMGYDIEPPGQFLVEPTFFVDMELPFGFWELGWHQFVGYQDNPKDGNQVYFRTKVVAYGSRGLYNGPVGFDYGYLKYMWDTRYYDGYLKDPPVQGNWP